MASDPFCPRLYGLVLQGVDVSAFEESAVLHNDSGITKPISGITTFKGLVLKDLQ